MNAVGTCYEHHGRFWTPSEYSARTGVVHDTHPVIGRLDDERTVDECGHPARQRPGGGCRHGPRLLGGVDPPANTDSRSKALLSGRQQVIGQLHDTNEGAVTRVDSAAAGKQFETLVEPVGELAGGHQHHATQSQSGSPSSARLPPRPVPPRWLRGHGLVPRTPAPKARRDLVDGCARGGNPSRDATGHTVSPGMPIGSRLVARTRTPGHRARSLRQPRRSRARSCRRAAACRSGPSTSITDRSSERSGRCSTPRTAATAAEPHPRHGPPQDCTARRTIAEPYSSRQVASRPQVSRCPELVNVSTRPLPPTSPRLDLGRAPPNKVTRISKAVAGRRGRRPSMTDLRRAGESNKSARAIACSSRCRADGQTGSSRQLLTEPLRPCATPRSVVPTGTRPASAAATVAPAAVARAPVANSPTTSAWWPTSRWRSDRFLDGDEPQLPQADHPRLVPAGVSANSAKASPSPETRARRRAARSPPGSVSRIAGGPPRPRRR